MIIKKESGFEQHSVFLNIDWYNEGNFIVDETTEEGQLMAQTYISNYPFVDFEHDGEFVTKVIVLENPIRPIDVEGKLIKLIKSELGEWEYVYVDIPLTKEQEIELKLVEQEAIIQELIFEIIPSLGGM